MAKGSLTLERFLPYRLSVVTNRVSGALSRHYATRFGISIPEWRVIANLGRYPGLSANQVAERSAMDKVTVSRAVAGLERKGLLERVRDDLQDVSLVEHMPKLEGRQMIMVLAPKKKK